MNAFFTFYLPALILKELIFTLGIFSSGLLISWSFSADEILGSVPYVDW
jgi:hypothetical protein